MRPRRRVSSCSATPIISEAIIPFIPIYRRHLSRHVQSRQRRRAANLSANECYDGRTDNERYASASGPRRFHQQWHFLLKRRNCGGDNDDEDAESLPSRSEKATKETGAGALGMKRKKSNPRKIWNTTFSRYWPRCTFVGSEKRIWKGQN